MVGRVEVQQRKGLIHQVQQVMSIIAAMCFTCAILVLFASLPLVGSLSILKINVELTHSQFVEA
jgi:hypothetical protein